MASELFLRMPGHYIRRAQQVSSAYFAEELAARKINAPTAQDIACAIIAIYRFTARQNFFDKASGLL